MPPCSTFCCGCFLLIELSLLIVVGCSRTLSLLALPDAQEQLRQLIVLLGSRHILLLGRHRSLLFQLVSNRSAGSGTTPSHESDAAHCRFAGFGVYTVLL